MSSEHAIEALSDEGLFLADIAYLIEQTTGATQAECVRAAIVAYLAAAQSNPPAASQSATRGPFVIVNETPDGTPVSVAPIWPKRNDGSIFTSLSGARSNAGWLRTRIPPGADIQVSIWRLVRVPDDTPSNISESSPPGASPEDQTLTHTFVGEGNHCIRCGRDRPSHR